MPDEAVVGRALIELRAENVKLRKDLEAAQAGVNAAMTKIEREQAKTAKAIQAQLDKLNATRATAQMDILSKAINQIGGVSKLSSDQVQRLTKDVERLAAAGAKVPKNLAGLGVGKGGGLGAGISGALAGMGPGGMAGAALGALGPGGIAAGAVLAGIAAITKGFIEESDALDELSKKTGVNVATLDAWGLAAKTSGVTAEQLAETTLKLSANIAQGDSVFERLGLKLEDLRNKTPEEQFAIVGQRILELKTPGEQAAAALEAMGKSGTDALQALRDGFLDNLPAAKAHALGLEESRKEAAALADSIAELDKSWGQLKAGIGAVAVPVLKVLVDSIRDTADEFSGLGELFGGGKGKKFLGDASFYDVTGGASTTGGPKPAPAGPRFKSAAESAAAEAAAGKVKTQQEKDTRDRIALAKQVTEQTQQLNALLADQEIAFHKRVTDDLQKEMDRRVALAKEAEEQILADFLLANDIKNEQINAQGEKVAIVTQAAMDAARRRVSAAAGGTGQLVSDISDEGLPTQFFSRYKDVNDELEKNKGHLFEVKEESKDWAEELANVAHIIETIPGGLGKVGSSIAGLAGGIAGIGASLKGAGGLGGIGKSLTGGTATSMLGKLGSIAGGLGAAGQIATAAFGIGKAIVGLFKSDPVKKAQKEAGKILGHEVSREMAEQLVNESKTTGKSITELAKKMKADAARDAAVAKRQQVEEGLATFQAGFEQAEAALADLAKSPALEAAMAQIGAKLDEALGKAGIFRVSGALKESKAFGAAQTAAGGLAQAAAGARQAGVLDTGLSAALGVAATELRAQATVAAKAAGLGDVEAQKAGFGAVAGLLREQLNAELQANGKVSAALQAQLDEAKANGIEILADPAIEQLDVAKQQLEVMEKGFGVVADKVDKGLAPGAGTGMPPIPFVSPNVPVGAAFTGEAQMAQILASLQGLGGGGVQINMGDTHVTASNDPWQTRQQAEQGAIDAVLGRVEQRDARFTNAVMRMLAENGIKPGQ